MREREKFDNEWAISEITEPLSYTGGGGRRGEEGGSKKTLLRS